MIVKLCFWKDLFLTSFRLALPEYKKTLLPVDKYNKEVIQLLKSNTEWVIYSLDQQIVTQKFGKPLLRNGKTVTEKVLILGRNVALTEICKVLLIDYKEYKRLESDKEI